MEPEERLHVEVGQAVGVGQAERTAAEPARGAVDAAAGAGVEARVHALHVPVAEALVADLAELRVMDVEV